MVDHDDWNALVDFAVNHFPILGEPVEDDHIENPFSRNYYSETEVEGSLEKIRSDWPDDPIRPSTARRRP